MNLKVSATFIIVICVSGVGCPRVTDTLTHKRLHVSDYCPSIGNCEEGTHVVCMYYNPNKKMGPRCVNPQNTSITEEYALKILEVINGIRSKVSRGTAKGKDDKILPRGYGIIRLEWDEELATLAQLWADQCTQKTDYCRATSQFPNAGQMVGVNRFRLDWTHITGMVQFNKSGYTKQKERYALIHIIRSWYQSAANMLTRELVENKDIPTGQRNLDANHFLNMFSGSTTHIGCGISAFTEVRDVVTLPGTIGVNMTNSTILTRPGKWWKSARLDAGKPIYNIHPPTEIGFTVKCGCPPDYDEDETCLCYKNTRSDFKSGCKPNVVVLPIFTVEDPPVNQNRKQNSNSLANYQRYGNDRSPSQQYNDNYSNLTDYEYKKRKSDNYPSLFSRTSLTGNVNRKRTHGSNPIQSTKIKKDVRSRRDFSKLQEIVDLYFNEKHNINTNYKLDTKNKRFNYKKTGKEFKNLDAERHKIFYQQYFNSNNSEVNGNEYKYLTDEKVILLLNKLAQEIDNTDLDSHDRQIIDKKILNIYNILHDNTAEIMYQLRNKDKKAYNNNNNNNNLYISTTSVNRNNNDLASNNILNYSSLKKFLNNDHNYQTILTFENNLKLPAKKIRGTLDIRQPNNELQNNWNIYNYNRKNKDEENLLNYNNIKDFLSTIDNRHEQLADQPAHTSGRENTIDARRQTDRHDQNVDEINKNNLNLHSRVQYVL